MPLSSTVKGLSPLLDSQVVWLGMLDRMKQSSDRWGMLENKDSSERPVDIKASINPISDLNTLQIIKQNSGDKDKTLRVSLVAL